ncbi:NitT/TauT family transport system ATP-binding protein [Breoghania corrubedonensis]|uniref:NitT/TauT family transport system ATP-binding protein n=2 Tax=Breoghania corrubedonensis TaxID=665038 RepID=A0A2T5VHH0_9HYPH|nr:CmpA/NrtA family ABC transporter substrate-binding protein [Breoghania corrubedonensis]PTW63193.1 NitT/TauT family transport system ATP-binding protein [Breoghania corrubedonensis]
MADNTKTEERTVVRAGFMPLVDCAPLVVAACKGFAENEGLTLQLVRESSWATIRDKVVFGHFEVAHMLAGMPIARSLGIGHLTVPMIAPCALGLGGNAITVSAPLFESMEQERAGLGAAPASNGAALARVVRKRASSAPLVFAMVYPVSSHNYELRYWLAAAGIHPDRDVRLVVIPPPLMADAISAGHIDGFCVGEPWNSMAVEAGTGRIVATKSEIWRQSPGKVLGCRRDWADANAGRLAALIRALYHAGQWADDPANHEELAHLLAQPRHVGEPARIIMRALSGRMVLAPGADPIAIPDFQNFHRHAATFPWRSHALWFFSQMVRWGQTTLTADNLATTAGVYRPDLYRAALAGTGAALPAASSKVEGALTRSEAVAAGKRALTLGPDGFFDGRTFDPDRVEAYIDSFEINSRNGSLEIDPEG